MTLLILLILSIIIVFGIVGLAVLDANSEERNFLSKRMAAADPHVKTFLSKLWRHGETLFERGHVFIVHHTPHYSMKFIEKVSRRVRDKHGSLIQTIAGRRSLGKRGPASFFLSTISEHKKNNGNNNLTSSKIKID